MIFLAALAVYKVLQVILALLPREVQPWVKVVGGVILSVPAAFLAGLDNVAVSALAVATLAGAVHSVLRLVTYVGDFAFRKSLK